MTTLLRDARLGLRLLARQPGFTAIAVLVLAVGIGVNTAAFSLVNALLLKPRGGGVDDRLAGLYSRDRSEPDSYRDFSWADYAALRNRRDLFDSLTAHSFGLVGLQEGEHTRRVFADIVTASFFETFGVRPIRGRAFTAEEERPGADIPVVILSHTAWRRMGSTDDVIGHQVRINQRPFTIVGVAPEGFGGSMVLATPEVFVPTGVYETLAFDALNIGQRVSLADPDFRSLIVVARLPTGATIESLEVALEVADARLAEANPAANSGFELQLAPLSRMSVSTRPTTDSEISSAMGMVVSLASVVLLIASFNLSNMLFARGQSRRKEFAIRLAIGGSRRQLLRQLLTESLILSLAGGACGVLLAWWSTHLLFGILPPVLPIGLAFDPAPDIRVLTAALTFSVAAALLFGLGPAWRLSRTHALPALRDQSGDAGGRRRVWLRWLTTRDTLVMGQLALTFVMLTVAGLFVRGAVEAARSDPGFTLDRGIIANIDTSLAGFDEAQSRTYFGAALGALRSTTGIVDAGFASHMPFGEIQSSRNIRGPASTDAPGAGEDGVAATIVSISRGYFDALEIPIVRGRDFTDAEAASPGGEPLAIIDTELARRLFGDGSPVGLTVQSTIHDTPETFRVVGVVGGVRPDLFSQGPEPFIYFPFGQQFMGNLYLHARTGAASAEAERALLPTVAAALRSVDARVPFVSLETRPMFRERNLVLAVIRTGAALFAAFGLGALLLAAAGVYAVKAYLVSQRTREIGIRVALGAEPGRVIRLIVGEGLALVAIGLAIGIGLSLVTGYAVRGALFQGRALDLPVVALSAATLAVAFAAASWWPARRATRLAPTTALRTQ